MGGGCSRSTSARAPRVAGGLLWGVGVGYVAGLAIKVTPLTDPDYRPFSRRLAWLAADDDGNPVGSAYLRIYSKSTQAHLTELELTVHPAERRSGVGSRLLAAAVEAARGNEARVILADATVGSEGDHFLAARGFIVGLRLIFARLPLAEVDHGVLAPLTGGDHPGYRLESWTGLVPDHLAQTFTDARTAMDDAPVGAIEYGVETWDVERTRFVAQQVEQRGDHLATAAAVEVSTGKIVAFTELVVPGNGKGDAQHYGTAVLPDHRGRGLALWLKAAGIRQALDTFPDLDGLLADTVDTNLPMQRINHTLGYRPTHHLHRHQLNLH